MNKMNNGLSLTLVERCADHPEATYQCECGEIFDVDACTQENLELDEEGMLRAVCPKAADH